MDYDQVLSSASIQATYAPIHRQRFYLEQPQIMSASLELEGGYTPAEVCVALNQVVKEQSALRTTYLPDKDQFYEYEKTRNWSIPCFDTRGNRTAREHLTQALLVTGPDEQLYCSSSSEQLLAKQVIIRLEQHRYQIHLFAHHSIWDLKSSELWGERIRHFLDGGSIREVLPFSSFAKAETDPACSAPNHQYLDGFLEAARSWNTLWQSQPVDAIHKTFSLEQAAPALLADPLGISMALVQKSMHAMCPDNLLPEKLPFLILYHNRNETNGDVAGLFPDLLPILLPAHFKSEDVASQQMELLLEAGKSCVGWEKKLTEQLGTVARGIPIVNVAAHFITQHNQDLEQHLKESFDTLLKEANYIYPLNLQMRLSPSTVTISMIVPASILPQMEEYLSRYVTEDKYV
jgi:hypothetical protein